VFVVPLLAASFCDTQGGWKQVWKDDFNTFDSNSWTVTLGQNSGQGRDAFLTRENVYTENSNLVLKSQKQSMSGLNYTSGAVTSQNKRFWQHGRFCISARLPGGGRKGQGQGIWPAHWMMPNDASCWPDHGEIDIMEMINGDGTVHGTYHWNKLYPAQKCTGERGNTAQGGVSNIGSGGWASQYHEYAAEWGVDYIAFVLDGKPYINITNSMNPKPAFPPSPMFFILNTAVGGPWPGPPTPETVFPTYHYLDYVAVAQRQ